MWIARIVEKGKDDRGLTITVLFSEGENEVKEVFAPGSKNELDRIISSTLDKLNANSVFVGDVDIGDYTPPAFVEDEDVRKLQAALADYGKWQRAMLLGLASAEQAEESHAKLVAAFRPDLIDFLVG